MAPRLALVVLAVTGLSTARLHAANLEVSLPAEPTYKQATASRGPTADRATPRAAVAGFLAACRHHDYAHAATIVHLPPGNEALLGIPGDELARRITFVFDQTLWIDLESLSDSPDGDASDNLPANRDRAGTIATARGDVDILLERSLSDEAVPTWRITPGTVTRINELYERSGYDTILRWLPRPLVDISILEVALWQWLGLMLLLVLSFLAAWIAARILVRFLRPLAARTRTYIDDRLIELTTGPLRLLATIAFLTVSSRLLRLGVPVRHAFSEVAKLLVICGVAWLILRFVDLLAAITRDRLRSNGRVGATHLVPLGARALKVAIAVVAFLAALENLGFDVTTVVAGLGVGGLAVALAAQKTIENVFGGISVLVDQPVLPGDFCRFGDQIGTVEDVGIRSTRIRTLERTVISIPNAEFSTLRLENFAKRDRIWLKVTLGLRYETSSDQLRYVITELRKMLIAHPCVLPDPLRARFVGFGSSSLDIEIFGYVGTSDYNEFLAVREDIYLRIIDIVQGAGTGFAYPSSTTYLARDEGLDSEKARAAEGTVEQWRREGRLMFPEFAREEIERLDGTLDFPPKGSSVGARA